MFDAVGYNYHSIGEIIKFLEIDLIPITSEMDFYIYPSVIHSDDTCLTAVRSPLEKMGDYRETPTHQSGNYYIKKPPFSGGGFLLKSTISELPWLCNCNILYQKKA